MKKEKKIRTYQRRTKSGKTITVRAHTASYEASEKNKEVTKKKGAGDELKKKKSSAPADLGFTADEFKIWANDLDEKEAKRIDKILVKKYGEKAVQKLADEINAGNSRTHKAVFARLSSEKPVKKVATKTAKSLPEIKIPEKPKLRDKNFSSKISDYNAALDYRHYREAVLRGDKKAISDAKYNLTSYLGEEAESTSLTQKISKLTGIPLGASRDASKSSEKTTKTKSSETMSKSAKETSSKKQVLHGEAKNMGASAIKYNNKTYMVTTDGKVETVTGRKVGKALSDKILDENKAAIKSYATTLKKEDKKGSAEHEKKTSKTTKTKSSQVMPKTAKSMPTKKWVITYNEQTPMGLSSSKDRKVIVEAKTMRGAEGIYKKKYHRGSDSAYATTLYNIEPYEG